MQIIRKNKQIVAVGFVNENEIPDLGAERLLGQLLGVGSLNHGTISKNRKKDN